MATWNVGNARIGGVHKISETEYILLGFSKEDNTGVYYEVRKIADDTLVKSGYLTTGSGNTYKFRTSIEVNGEVFILRNVPLTGGNQVHKITSTGSTTYIDTNLTIDFKKGRTDTEIILNTASTYGWVDTYDVLTKQKGLISFSNTDGIGKYVSDVAAASDDVVSLRRDGTIHLYRDGTLIENVHNGNGATRIAHFKDKLFFLIKTGQLFIYDSASNTITSSITWVGGNKKNIEKIKITNGRVVLVGESQTWQILDMNLNTLASNVGNSAYSYQDAILIGKNNLIIAGDAGVFNRIVLNVTPIIKLDTPTANTTLYENDGMNIAGIATDADTGNSITVRYQINTNTARAIKAFVSTGAIESFTKKLTFKSGSLYDGNTLIVTNLKDGVPHTLKVWATDDQGGQSAVVERTFYVVPNRAPRLEVTPPTIEGNIDSDTFTVSGTYADDDKNEVIISYRINGSISKEVARGTDGAFDFTVSFAQLKNGNNTISVEAIDSYGAKTSRTIKLNKNTIATPLLQSTVRYLIQPPKGSAQAVLLWLQRDQDLAVTASLHMGMKGEAEAFTLLEPTNTAPLRDNATILEDEFYHEADGAKDHIILQLDMKRSSVESTAAIHLISGVFE